MVSSPPKPPDPTQVANAETVGNTKTAITSSVVNNPNEKTPFGSVKYKVGGYYKQRGPNGQMMKIPRWKRVVSLSPDEKRKLKLSNKLGIGMLDATNNQIRTISDTLSKPMDFSGVTDRVSSVDSPRLRGKLDLDRVGDGPDYTESYTPRGGFSKDRRRVERALMSRLSPQFDRDRSQLESNLLNQGFQRGTEAFENAMDESRRSETDARFQAVLAGGQEQSRLLGEARGAAGFENAALQQGFRDDVVGNQLNNAATEAELRAFNTARQQDFANDTQSAAFQNDARASELGELYAARNQPLNEMGAALSGGQVNTPQFQSMFRQGVQPAPIGDYMYRSYEGELAAHQAQMQGMFGLGSSVIGGMTGMFGLSDARTKEDIKPIGETEGGLPLYSYRYKGDPETRIGPMAQEVAQKQPEAAGQFPSGLLGVDYRKIH